MRSTICGGGVSRASPSSTTGVGSLVGMPSSIRPYSRAFLWNSVSVVPGGRSVGIRLLEVSDSRWLALTRMADSTASR